MALEDLTPFGTLPSAYQGLLSTEDTAALQKKAQIQGLLGAGLALAKGMSSYGPPRSALQNIIGAVAGGFEGAGGAYEGGLKQAMTAQDIRQKQIQFQQAEMLRKDVENVMRTPEVANNPSLVALLRADPKKGLEWINENMAISRAYAPQQPAAPRLDETGKVLEAQPVVAPLDKRAQLFQTLDRLSGVAGEGARKEKEIILKQIEALDKQEEIVRKQQDFTNEARRVAAAMFNGRRIEELLPKELEQLQTRLDEIETAKRRAGATTINMPTESERGAGYLTARLQNSLAQYQDVVGGNPKAALPTLSAEVVKGVTRSDYLKNLVNPEDRQRVEAAQLDMISAALTLSTGAAYTKEELEAQRAALFPQLGDKPATIRDKAVRLNNLLNQAKIKAGRAAPAATTNAPVTFDINAINQELENRKKGK